MKAIFKTKKGPGIEVVDTDIPKIGENDFLVKVAVSSICGTDLQFYRWEENKKGPNWWDEFVKLPVILGHEFSGQVVEVGNGVKKVAVGDRIVASPLMACGECDMCLGGRPDFCFRGILGHNVNGSMAEFLRLSPSATVYKLPDHVSYEAASLIEPLCVGLHGVEVSGIKPGDTVAVLGPGPIGLFILQVIKAAGAGRVLMTGKGTDKNRLDLAARLGADRVIDVDKEDAFEIVMDATNGEGADLVFEASGNSFSFSQALRLAKTFGKVVATGMYADTTTFDPILLSIGNKSMIGSAGYEASTWKRALTLVSRGSVSPEAIIGRSFPLAEGEAAFELAARREVAKVVLTP